MTAIVEFIQNPRSPTETNWTTAGAEHTDGQRDRLLGIIDGLEWTSVPCDGPMAPLEAIKEAIKELRIPKVNLVAFKCNELAPYGLLGVQGHYKNGRARVFILDRGSDLVPLVSMFWSKEP